MSDTEAVWGRRNRRLVRGGRDMQVKAWVSEPEKLALEVRAHENGISVARLLVQSALGGGFGGAVGQERLLRELTMTRTLLSRMSSNINQIARWANSEKEFPGDAAAAVAAARGLMRELDALMDRERA